MPAGPPDSLSSALTRNIRKLEERRAREAVATTRQEKVVVAITSFMGSMPFVYLHAAFYGAWVLAAFGTLAARTLGWAGLSFNLAWEIGRDHSVRREQFRLPPGSSA